MRISVGFPNKLLAVAMLVGIGAAVGCDQPAKHNSVGAIPEMHCVVISIPEPERDFASRSSEVVRSVRERIVDSIGEGEGAVAPAAEWDFAFEVRTSIVSKECGVRLSQERNARLELLLTGPRGLSDEVAYLGLIRSDQRAVEELSLNGLVVPIES